MPGIVDEGQIYISSSKLTISQSVPNSLLVLVRLGGSWHTAEVVAPISFFFFY